MTQLARKSLRFSLLWSDRAVSKSITADRSGARVPARHMIGVCLQIGTRLKVNVVELGVDVLGLHVAGKQDRWNGRRKFSVGVVQIRSHLSDAIEKFCAIGSDASFHLAGVQEGSQGLRIVGSGRPEFSLRKF